MKIGIILGTRPEFIKMAPIIRELEARKADFFLLHTGQHYSANLDGIFFEQLNLPKPRHALGVGSASHAEQTAKILTSAEKVLLEEKPDCVLVQGDTNSVLAGALAAAKLQVKVGHVEAGLRSYDRTMPEEINRVIADHCAEYLFAPTEKAKAILRGEGIPAAKIFVTGNTIVDAVFQNVEIARARVSLSNWRVSPNQYVLVTVHRQENIHNKERFTAILEGLEKVAAELKLPVLYPVHPHSRKMMEQFKLKPAGLTLLEPLDYLSFLLLENHARLILTDSGGVQEESCVLKVPCVTLRDNTERPETIEVGANLLAGTAPDKIMDCSREMLGRDRSWANPFGDGKAGKKTVSILLRSSHG
ncbi:MAG: UDP-N-acetylglucosamine 2-epimerase (non-hydrolyzing) [Dehalococcoidales bacterium]|nr:UDP-N-acetylglucosamine 2-epimerase (non-hydrolyzing) [Dehalococcoidales bacterium]